jgi:inner membrane protein involved in colicin E2 resistance
VLGTTTILQLSRLRAAWYESMLAMNQMKDFVIRNSSIDIEGAFRWRATTAPSKFKINSVSFYQAVEVAILSGLLFGAFIFFLLDVLKVSNPFIVWGASIGLGLLNIWFQIYLYRQLLK